MAVQKQLLNEVPEEDVHTGDGDNHEQQENEVETDQSHPMSNEDNDEYVVIKLSDVFKEVQCPICLGIIRKTRTVMECLHRFCRECIDKSMRLCNNECPACRTHCASRRSLRDDPTYDTLIAALFPDIDKFEEEEDEVTRNRLKETKQTQFPQHSATTDAEGAAAENIPDLNVDIINSPGTNARNNRISRLIDHLRNSDINEEEMDIHLRVVSLDEQSIPSLEESNLCCKRTMSVKILCQFVGLKTGVEADQVELFLVKEPQAEIMTDERPVVPDDKLHVLGEQQTLAELPVYGNLCCGHLILAYRRKLQNSDTVGQS